MGTTQTYSLHLATEKGCSAKLECRRCGHPKTEEDFSLVKWKSSKGEVRSGRRRTCRECESKTVRAWRKNNPAKARSIDRNEKLKWRYGITTADFTRMLADQDGHCATCPSTTDLVVDHDHKTGKVRGILCGPCNRSIGILKEDVATIRKLAEYLENVCKLMVVP